MLQNMYRLYLVALLSAFVKVNSQLRWEVKTVPVVFGEDIVLTCHELGNVCTHARSWVGGNDYKLLCFNDTSKYPSKYQMISDNEKREFNLVIKNFRLADVNCEYTCVCGFHQYTNSLQLTDMSYIFPPNMDIADASYQGQHNCRFHLNVTIQKVYPEPECSIVYSLMGQIIHTEKVQLKMDKLKEGMFYTAALLKEYDLNHNITDKLSLTCIVGERHYKVYSWQVKSCSDKPLGDSFNIVKLPYFIPLMMVAGTLLCIICVAGIYILRKICAAKSTDGGLYVSMTTSKMKE